METSILEIKTDSSLGSYERVNVDFFKYYSSSATGVTLHFTSPPQYELKYCTYSRTDFSTDLPTETDKVWRITMIKTPGIRLVIQCNEVEVLNFLLSDSTCSYSSWNYYWNRDVAKIRFDSWDTASDYYRLRGKGRHVSYTFLSCEDKYNRRTINNWGVPNVIIQRFGLIARPVII